MKAQVFDSLRGDAVFDSVIQAQIDKNGHFIISEQSIKAIAEAVVKKLTEAKHDN